LLAFDGSALNLPPSPELIESFGHHHTNSIGTKIPQARTSLLVDLLNKITVDAQIESFRISEQEMFRSQLVHVGKGDLITADANYGHFWMFKLILKAGADFCIRMSHSSNFIKEFLETNKRDVILEWLPSPKTKENCRKNGVCAKPLTIRLVRVELPKGETEVLALSITNQKYYSYDHIIDLYEERWDVEETYKKLMQRLIVEFFSSKKENGIRQDFHANIFMMNVVALLAEHVESDLVAHSRETKYDYQINWSSALGDIRQRLSLFFIRSQEESTLIIESIWESMKANTCSIRPGRMFPRDKRKKGSRQKAFMNYKPAF
jgi:hypothetical protein